MKSSFRFISSMVQQVKGATETLRTNSISSLSVLLPAIACVISFIKCLVLYISFILSGGYVEQIDKIKSGSVFEDLFTASLGALPNIWVIDMVIWLLLLFGFIFLLVAFFKKEHWGKRIIMIADISAEGIAVALLLFLNAIYSDKIDLAPDGLIANALIGIDMEKAFIILIIICAVFVLLACILVFFTENRNILKFTLKASLLSGIFIPVFFWIVRHIVTLAVLAVLTLILGLIFHVVISSIGEGGAGESGAPSVPKASKAQPEKMPEKKIPEMRFEGKVSFFVDDGDGISAPNTKCIFAKNFWHNRKYVCTLKAYKNGEFYIYVDGKTFRGI